MLDSEKGLKPFIERRIQRYVINRIEQQPFAQESTSYRPDTGPSSGSSL